MHSRSGWVGILSGFPLLIQVNRHDDPSFTSEELEKKEGFYNFTIQDPSVSELPGVSVFYKDPSGKIFHTYSAYARGIDY